jgi:NADPH:quinone reductase-like Zn-dependent oxidoreductase
MNLNTMKAAVYTKYGLPDVLAVKSVDKPVPKDNEVLIRVFATTVNRTDCAILTARPFIMRLITGLFKPNKSIPGTDFAGSIEAIGKDVTSFKVDDRVFGFDDSCLSSQAQYLTLAVDKALAIMPDQLSFEQAAACLEGAHYAYNITNKVTIKPGQEVLVNGATGAIGIAVLQLSKFYGARVTAVCDNRGIELVKSLGADKVIDYTREDFTRNADAYDFVFDAVGKSTFGKCKQLLKPGGVYASTELGPWIQNLFLALVTPLFGGKKVIFPFPYDIKGSINFIKDLIIQNKFKPVLDRTYPLEKIGDAYTYVLTGQKLGNVIIKVE